MKERERERERQTDRQRHRDTEKETETERERGVWKDVGGERLVLTIGGRWDWWEMDSQKLVRGWRQNRWEMGGWPNSRWR